MIGLPKDTIQNKSIFLGSSQVSFQHGPTNVSLISRKYSEAQIF